MPYQRICHLFFLFKLAVSLLISKKILSLTLFKIITGSRSSSLLRVFLMGRSGCPTKKKNERWGSLPVSQKVWSFSFCWKSPPAKNWDHLSPDNRYIGKKVLIAFRQILSKILPEACIFSDIIMTYLKKLVGTNFLNTKLCLAALFPRIVPHFLPKHSWKTLEMEDNPTQQPKCTHLPHQKNHPYEIYFFCYQKCHSFTWNSNFYLITL